MRLAESLGGIITIGTALVIIAVLYLIDKYKLWKKAAIAIAALAGVLVIGLFAWKGYDKWRQMRAEQKAAESQRVVVGEEDIDACPPNGYHYVEKIGCNDSPKTLPKEFFNNSDVKTKLACYNPATGKLTPDPFEEFGGKMRNCSKGELMVSKD